MVSDKNGGLIAEVIFPGPKVDHTGLIWALNYVCKLSDRLRLRELVKIIGNGTGQEDSGAGTFWLRK